MSREGFNKTAATYESERRKLIPCFDDYYGRALDFIESSVENPEILDLGAGTGLFSAMVRAKFPRSKMVLADIAEEMLSLARQRFAGDQGIEFEVCDYASPEAFSGRKFDLIVSALSIHHLEDPEKAKLFQKVRRHLREGGRFVNADQVLGPDGWFAELYESEWKKIVEASGLSRQALDAGYERRKLDRLGDGVKQVHWMREAGFRAADIVYKNGFFAVFAAIV